MNLRMTAAAACALLTLTACGGEDADPKDPKATTEAKPYATGVDDPFTVKDVGGPTQVVYGHGIVTEIPDGWKPRSKELAYTLDYGPDESTGIRIVMGEKQGPQDMDAKINLFLDVAETDSASTMGKTTSVAVPDAVEAQLVDFTQDRDGQKTDNAALFLEAVEGRGSSVFLTAPRGQRADLITPIIDNLSVQAK